MKLANLNDRGVIVTPQGAIDVGLASAGTFGPSMPAILDSWDAFREWVAALDLSVDGTPVDFADLSAPSPTPRQVFGIGHNYAHHIKEVGAPVPDHPLVFTKFQSSITGPYTDLPLYSERTDWEVELVVVIGRRAQWVPVEGALDYAAGFTLGQDVSDRDSQFRPSENPQHSLGKSRPGYGPTGPLLVTLDEFDHTDGVEISCEINSEVVQRGYTSDLLFSVPQLISYLSHLVTLLPGDLIFTGTPAGVGFTRNPARFLRVGDVVVSSSPHIGTLRQLCVAPPTDTAAT